MLEFPLPLRVRTERVAGNGFALGLDREHFAGIIENRGRGRLFCARPFCVSERAQFRRAFADADMTRIQVSLLERNIELCFFGELERENFLFPIVRCRNFSATVKAADAVLEVNNEIAFVQLAEIDLRSMALRVIKAATRVRRESPEQFGRRQNDKVGRRKTKTARECAEDKIDIMQRVGADQFAKTLNLAFSLKIDDDARVVLFPFAEML